METFHHQNPCQQAMRKQSGKGVVHLISEIQPNEFMSKLDAI